MRPLLHRALLAALALTSLSALSQMHKVAKPEQVVRAIGVYEWTGDFNKPTASRLIPVSLYIEGHFQDAGIYIARPVPFALLSGNVYELQDAGIGKGLLDLAYARHLQATDATGDLAYDDGWFGYGAIKPLAAPRRVAALKPSKTLPVLTSSKSQSASTSTAATSDDPDRPTMKRRNPDTTTSTTSSTPAAPTTTPTSTTARTPPASTTNTASTSSDDPDRPTMKRRNPDTTSSGTSSTPSSTTSTTTASSTPTDDPDRPTMKRHDSSGNDSGSGNSTTNTTSTASTSSTTPADDPDRPTMSRRNPNTSAGSDTSTASTSDNDPDRPTLKRHSPEEAKRAHNDSSSVAPIGGLNDDPDRPNLHRGKPTQAMTETDLPKLVGLPSNLHQMVAVSDAVNRDPHPYTLAWDDATQRSAILQKMQAMARAQLDAYGKPPSATPPALAVKKTVSTQSRRTTKPAPAPALVLLADEELKAYTLSYGGDPTYIYSAHTAGTGAALRYVTIVAQANSLGDLKPAIQNVTDAAHLDRTPRMRFVDVVDAEASNRASLLFELRGQNARQFGLYRVIAAHSEQIFLTGTTQ